MRFNPNLLLPRWGMCFLVLLITGCGGSGDTVVDTNEVPNNNPPPATPTKSIEGGGIISRFGAGFRSVTVNAKTFDTTSTTLTVTIDGETATLQDLDVGDAVVIQATTDDDGVTSVADAIVADSLVEGPIASGSLDAVNQTFVVLGQTVLVQAGTLFDDSIVPSSFDGLNEGDSVEVHGVFDANGQIIASRIEANPANELEVNGTISNLDAAGFTFNINSQVVDYASAVLDDFSNGGPMNGDLVEVEGTTLGSNGELIAVSVELKNPMFTGDDGDLAEIEGFVTRFVSETDFDVAGLPVTTNAQTQYEDGTAADLALNVRVEVEGDLNASGVLVAREVEFKTGEEEAEVEISATINSIDATTNTLDVLGITVNVTPSTRLEDKSDADVRPFNISDLNLGDFVEIEGFEDPIGSQQVTAVSLERDDNENEVELAGFVESVADPEFVILGITCRTDAGTEFRDANDQPISAAQFFSGLTQGALAECEGLENAGLIVAEEVELEN